MLQCSKLMHISECKKMHKNCLCKNAAIFVHILKVSEYLALCYDLPTVSTIRIEMSGALHFKYPIDIRYCFYRHDNLFIREKI